MKGFKPNKITSKYKRRIGRTRRFEGAKSDDAPNNLETVLSSKETVDTLMSEKPVNSYTKQL